MSTRDKLLKEATRLFAQKGYDGAATEAIVTASKVNKRMLYHYFGSKEGLYEAVLQQQWEALQQALGPNLVDSVFDFIAARPQFVRIMMWEGMRGGKTSRRMWAGTRGPMFAQAAVLLGLDAQQLISVLGALAFYFAYAPSLADALGTDPLSPPALAARKAHLHALLASITHG